MIASSDRMVFLNEIDSRLVSGGKFKLLAAGQNFIVTKYLDLMVRFNSNRADCCSRIIRLVLDVY